MLFAESAPAPASTLNTEPPPPPLPPPGCQLTSMQAKQQQHQPPGELIAGTTNKAEIMEVMKKLDADLVALFATAAASEPLEQQLKKKQQQQELWQQEQNLQHKQQLTDLVFTPQIFQRCNALQLHLEALTLQPEGTQRMELLQSEVRPIFTVECQLSEELIKSVPHFAMFHIMQFESEKFQSLTQCTRFGQTAQREVRLAFDEDVETLGHIDFTVWWREPGTCLNEMLGMGRLQLKELFEASLLEQCKCIAIKRRDVHLGSLYLKISLLMAKTLANNNNNNNNNSSQKQDETPSHNNSKSSSPVNNNNNNSKAPLRQPPSNNNNKASLDSVNFMAETSKVRLLRGYIYAGELRQLSPMQTSQCQELYIQPFWQQQPLEVKLDDQLKAFQLKEQFAIINDDKFLKSVERQQLLMEVRPLGGQVRLPLHQFYIAYRDASITNHLCKGKLPVISIDGWAPILHPQSQTQLGELKVLLAIGSETQIAQLKQLRGFDVPAMRRTTDLLDMLQNALTAPIAVASSTKAPPSLAQPTSINNFLFNLHITGAAGLPLNPGYGKTNKKQAKRQKRFPPNEPPNTYVTFQALHSEGATYKSHEGMVYATPIVEKSTSPQWRSNFQVEVSRDYLSNPQKLFILKLWKKAGSGTEPTPLEDAIIGFAALKLSGSSFPSGWHNIVDFNGRVTGGLEAHIEALPNVDTSIAQFEQSLDLNHLQLGQAIKRKFTELEEISQRLRTRLVDVTGENLKSPQFDLDEALAQVEELDNEDDVNADQLVEDFERCLRTPTPPSVEE